MWAQNFWKDFLSIERKFLPPPCYPTSNTHCLVPYPETRTINHIFPLSFNIQTTGSQCTFRSPDLSPPLQPPETLSLILLPFCTPAYAHNSSPKFTLIPTLLSSQILGHACYVSGSLYSPAAEMDSLEGHQATFLVLL